MTKTKMNLAARLGRLVLVLSPLAFTVSCAKPFEGAQDLANTASDVVGCESFQSDFFEGLYQFPIQKKAFPTEGEMRDQFAKSVTKGRLAKLSMADQQRVADSLTSLYKLLALDSVKALHVEASADFEKLKALTALEIGDSTTPEKEELQKQIHAEFTKLEILMATTGAPACSKAPAMVEAPTADAAGTQFSAWRKSESKVVYGALKTMATAYQSCDVGRVAPLGSNTPNVDGIKDLGLGPDGIGHRRLVADAAAILRSNPYLANYRKPASSCFDVTKTPLIYDYGGRPVTTTGKFDLFKNAGSGTAALGTDCSGFVFMALTTAGLRTKKRSSVKADTINGMSSGLFVNPQKNGLTCFDYARFSPAATLRAGDVVAKAGHVFMIKSVGADPFGVSQIPNVADCTIANMSTDRFNFIIIQDSSSKNGIGIHEHRAADYFQIPDSALMASGMLDHAVNACKAKFGQSMTSTGSHVSIVRHSGSADCLDREVQLERQSCVASCPAI